MDWLWLILWTVACLAVEGFFSGSELALVSCDKLRLTHRAARGDRGARLALNMANHPEWFFSTTLLGQNLFIVANTVMVTFFILDHLGAEYEFLAILLSPLILIFGEAVPKSIFQQVANRVVTKTTPVVILFSYAFFPVIWVLSKMTLLLFGGVRGSLTQGQKITPESLEFFINESDSPRDPRHELSLPLKNTLLKILNFSRHRVDEIMTPLADVFCIRKASTVGEVLKNCVGERYSLIPIYETRATNMVGMVHRLDLLREPDLLAPIAKIMKPPLYVAKGMGVKELFLTFQREQRNFAMVVDEYGGAVGIVSLEDILEEIVGEIEDEYDRKKQGWTQLGPSQYLFGGRVEIDAINERLKWGLPKKGYETLAGFLIEQKGGFPRVGEVLHFGELTFLIKEATERTVDKVLVEVGH